MFKCSHLVQKLKKEGLCYFLYFSFSKSAVLFIYDDMSENCSILSLCSISFLPRISTNSPASSSSFLVSYAPIVLRRAIGASFVSSRPSRFGRKPVAAGRLMCIEFDSDLIISNGSLVGTAVLFLLF